MSIRDYNKIINVQDLTTGDIACTIPANHDTLVTVTIPFYQFELIAVILDIIKDEHNICIKIGYKG